MEYKFHPFADVFPLLVGYDIDKLTEDIEENGQREPIILYDGRILDGRNRYRACIDLGIEPHFAQSTATNDEQALRESVSRNLRRRHLSPSQRSLAGARILPMFEALAREKQSQAGVDYGTGGKLVVPGPQALSERAPLSRDLAAKAVGAGASSVQRAKKVLNEAPDLVPALESGHIKVKAAAQLAKEDRETRDAVMSLVTSGEEKNVSKALDRVKGSPVVQGGRDRLPSAQHCQDVADIQAAEKRDGGVPKALLMSESNEWYTPSKYIDSARDLMGGIDLDPASCEQANETVKAEVYYTLSDDGLSKEWSGRVWMNPPYGKEDGESNQSRWTKRLIDSYENGEVTSAVFLVNAATDTDWFQRFWMYSICFVTPRVRFIRPDLKRSNPAHGNVFVYLGDDTQGFKDTFRKYGQIVIGEADDQGVSTAKRG